MPNPIHERFERGEARFRMIDQKLDTLIASMAALKQDVDELKTDVAETKEIVEAWSAVKTIGKFVKWTGGILAAVIAIGVAVKVGVAAAFRSVM